MTVIYHIFQRLCDGIEKAVHQSIAAVPAPGSSHPPEAWEEGGGMHSCIVHFVTFESFSGRLTLAYHLSLYLETFGTLVFSSFH